MTAPTGKPKQPGVDWWHILQWPLLLASAGVAAWVSYTQQRQLGIDVGWDHPWGLPIILDGLAAATLLSYIRKPQMFNRVVSTLVISCAVVGNAQAAIYDPDTAGLPAPLWAVIAWKVLPPVAVFTIAHYIAHERKDALDADRTAVVESARGDTDDPDHAGRAVGGGGVERLPVAHKAKRVSADRKPSARHNGDRTIEDLARTIADKGWSDLTWDELAKSDRLSCSKDRAGKARKLAREMALAPTNGNVTVLDR